MKVQTQDERNLEVAAWRRANRGVPPKLRAPAPDAGECYRVVYDAPDTQGRWGNRFEMHIFVRSEAGEEPADAKAAHGLVEALFAALMGAKPYNVIRVEYE